MIWFRTAHLAFRTSSKVSRGEVKRDPLTLDEDLNQLLVGRAPHVVGGFFPSQLPTQIL